MRKGLPVCLGVLIVLMIGFSTACGDEEPTMSPLATAVGYYVEDIGGDDGAYHTLTINVDLTGTIEYDGQPNPCHFVDRDGQLLLVVDSGNEFTDFPVGEYAMLVVDSDTILVEGSYGQLKFRRADAPNN